MMWMNRFGLLVLAMSALSACQLQVPPLIGGKDAAPETLQLSSSKLQVSAPEGYCFDRASLKEGANGSFVLMASCDPLLGNEVASDHAQTSLLSLTLTEPLPAASELTADALLAHFEAEETHGVLARSGMPDDVTILWKGVEDDVFLVHAYDSSRNEARGVSQDLWRAVTVFDDRLLSVSSSQFANTIEVHPENKALILDVVERFRQHNIGASSKIVSN